MKRKRPNTSGKEEPNKVSTWTYEFKGTDYGLNYFLERRVCKFLIWKESYVS